MANFHIYFGRTDFVEKHPLDLIGTLVIDDFSSDVAIKRTA